MTLVVVQCTGNYIEKAKKVPMVGTFFAKGLDLRREIY